MTTRLTSSRGLELLDRLYDSTRTGNDDIARAERAVAALVRVELTQPQFEALVSFVLDVGVGNFAHSTLLKELNRGRHDRVPEELVRWDKARGAGVDPGLTTRRRAEVAYWLDATMPALVAPPQAAPPSEPLPRAKSSKESFEGKPYKDDKDGKDGKDDKDYKDGKDDKDEKDGKDDKDYKDGSDDKEDKESSDGKDYKDSDDGKSYSDGKSYKDDSDGKDYKDGSDGKEGKDGKDWKDGKDNKDGKDGKETKEGKDYKDGKDVYDFADSRPDPMPDAPSRPDWDKFSV